MKNFIRECLVLSAVVLSMTACNDSFLERTPTNDLNDAAYWHIPMVFTMKRQAMALINSWWVSIVTLIL